MMRLACAPDLVEEAVLLAERTMSTTERQTFRRERNPLYEIADGDLREERFRVFHARWFARLGLHRPIEEAVAGAAGLSARVAEGRVLRAVTRQDEGADLVDQVSGSAIVRVLVIRLRPAALLEPAAVRAMLGHELLHVHDMLDPAFRYERSLRVDAGPLTETVLRDRYRVLWDATIDGRLTRAGAVGDVVRSARWREFEAVFPMLGGGARAAFDAWFDRDRPTHDDLLAFARRPTPMG